MVRPLLLFIYILDLCNGSCDLPRPLTLAGLENMDDGCIEVMGNLVLNDSNYEYKDDTLLTRKFKKVTTIFGCVKISQMYLETFKFMSNVRTINCSITENKGLNVIDIKFNWSLKKYRWDSLETIIGPGEIVLYSVCLSMHEVELFLYHPQYHGNEWSYLFDGEGRCSDNKKDCYFRYDPPDRIHFNENCRVMMNFTLNSSGFSHTPELYKLRNVRIILGGITIHRSWIADLTSILPNLELIYASVLGYLGPTSPAIRLFDNPYLSNISFPKLRRIKSMVSNPVIVDGSPLLSSSTNLYEGVQNIFFEDLPSQPFSKNPPIDYQGALQFGKFRIRNGGRLDGDEHKFNILIYGMYYPPIVISLLFNLRALSLFVFGSCKYSIKHLRWFYTFLALVHILIAVDSLLFYHDTTLVYFTPVPLLPKIILFNDALLVFCKTLFVFREIAMDIPLALILYVFISTVMSIIEKPPGIPAFIYVFVVICYFGFAAVTLYLSVDVRARRTMNAVGYGDPVTFPMDKYSMVAAINGNFSQENRVEDEYDGYGNVLGSRIIFEHTIYTDGLDMTSSKQFFEYITVALFGLYILIKLTDRKDRLNKLPYDLATIVILVQYSVLRYAALRNHLIRDVYLINCFGKSECAVRYSYAHTLTMITHHVVYILLGLCSALVWYTARYFHFLGAMMKTENLREATRMEDRSTFKN